MDARSPASQPLSCRSVTTTMVPRRPPAPERAADRAARYRVAPKPTVARSIADAASTRSAPGFAAISASSANVTTPTAVGRGALAIASFASCLARSNRPGADRLYDVSSATMVDAARRQRRAGRQRTGARRRAPAAPARQSAARAAAARAGAGVCGVFHRRVLQQLDRRELHPRLGLALQQVQHDRNARPQARPRETPVQENSISTRAAQPRAGP